jgi:hypothetical protein
MSKPQLPRRTADAWELSVPFEERREVRAIESRGGLVVAGGADLYQLRPGEHLWKHRPPPEDIGPVHVVAVEPRGLRRYAVASEKMFALFFKAEGEDQLLRITPAEGGPRVTQLAWGGVEGPCSLYVLQDDRSLLRMRPDLSGLDVVDLEEVYAIASDESGVIAMPMLLNDPQIVYLTRDGTHLEHRTITPELDLDAGVQVAVAGEAVALLIDGERVLLSRGPDDPFVRVEAADFPSGLGWHLGAVAFQGSTSDAPLLCARWESEEARIIRVEPGGAAATIVQISGTETEDAPDITSLSWDTTRQTLWAASPDLGIFACLPPGAKGAKKVSLS